MNKEFGVFKGLQKSAIRPLNKNLKEQNITLEFDQLTIQLKLAHNLINDEQIINSFDITTNP